MKINEIVAEDISRRGLIKGLAATAGGIAGAGIGIFGTRPGTRAVSSSAQSSATDINLNKVQRQYDWQFGDDLGPDTIGKIVDRGPGLPKAAITVKNQYFFIMTLDDLPEKARSALTAGPTNIMLMRVPAEALKEEQVEEDATPDAINDIVRLSRDKR